MNASHINFIPQEPLSQDYPPKKPKRFIFLIILLSILLIGGCITKAIMGEYTPEDPNKYDPITLEPKSPDGLFKKISYFVFSKENELDGYNDDRINLLLLGMGGLGHDGPFLTDTNIIASIKPSTGQIAMISIPRDLGVEIPGHGWNKINSANSFGETEKSGYGAEFARQTIEDIFDLKINYYARVDFKAFEEIINEIGGVTINVEQSFADHMYPAENYEYQTVEFSKGIQTMDGDTALKFVRSRHGNNGEGSDFVRARRQQKVLSALKEKVLSFSTLLNPIKINNIKNSLEKHITTNMNFADIMSFFKLIKELDTENITNLVLDDSPDNYLKNGYTANGAFILEPKTGNFKEINNLIENIFEKEKITRDTTPEQTTPPIMQPTNIEIQNGTWSVGMAARMKKRLEDKNFTITTVGNATEKPQLNSGIFKISDKDTSSIAQALQQELHIPIKKSLPENIQPTSTSDILILLGDDLEE
ncbi:MAG: LCP family protein [Candidatus Magasanikiibacteriota bacterium]